MWKNYLVAGLGGSIGVMLRIFLAKIFPANVYHLPSYILFVNALGCLLLGLIIEYFSNSVRYLERSHLEKSIQ